ncbi:MAG: metal ABC transporter substrate-binding protein [Bdellovibrionales bacterium]
MLRHLFLFLFCFMSALVSMPVHANVTPVRVTASFSILADMVQQIGGEAVEVKTLVGAGQDSHHYEPSPQDAAKLADAEIIAINGLHFEGWMGRLIEASGTNAKLLVAARGIVPRLLSEESAHHHHHDHDHDKAHRTEEPAYDPHAWQDLKNAAIYARNIAAALMEARPEYASFFQDQAAAYIQKIEALDAKLKQDFAAIPEAQRKVVSNHDAFGYFSAAYGVRFYAPVGVNENTEPSAKDMAKLIQTIKDENIHVLFVENMSSPRLMKQLAKDTKARVGGVLYADALSPPQGPAPTYLDMMTHNAELILKGIR